MRPGEEAARAAIRAYADSVEPPPVTAVIDRARKAEDAGHMRSTILPRRRRDRVPIISVAAAAAAIVVIAAVAVAVLDAGRDGDRGTTTATRPTASTGSTGMAPGCPPGLPVLEAPVAGESASAPPSVEAGKPLALVVRIPATDPDRRLLSVQFFLMPAGADINKQDEALSQSSLVQLTPDTERVSQDLQVPAGLAAGTYDLVGHTTWPGPSLCGVENPADSTQIGSSWGVLGSVVVD